jgi:uncharacterized alkaline shock family protein YloU
MENESSGEGSSRGATMIAPKVLITTARLTALGVPGVVGLAPVPGGVNRLFRRGDGEGVRIEVEGQTVAVDLHLIVAPGSNVRELGRKVQSEVARAIEELIGMSVQRIDIHIEDVDYSAPAS